MKFPDNNILPTSAGDITEQICIDNFNYWNSLFPIKEGQENELKGFNEILRKVLPAHTFAYYKNNFVPIKSIFGYDDKTGEFGQDPKGVVALKFRDGQIPDFGHMKTSKKLNHDIFNFAYLGVHNPYHRLKDDIPMRPFGVFIKKEVEKYSYCHGAPCDVAEENELVDKKELGKYYLKPEHLRIVKASEILSDTYFNDIWHYYGNPEAWLKIPDYGKNLFKRTGELRYYESIGTDYIEAILWPFFIDEVDYEDNALMDENLALYTAFRKAFPDITVIKYSHDDLYQQNWEITLVEASFYCKRYFLTYGVFPTEAKMAIEEFKNPIV